MPLWTISLPILWFLQPLSSKKNTKVATLNQKRQSYDMWNLGSGSGSLSDTTEVDGVEVGRMIMCNLDDATAAGSHEMRDGMKGLRCLLAKEKSGEFYIGSSQTHIISPNLRIRRLLPIYRKPYSAESTTLLVSLSNIDLWHLGQLLTRLKLTMSIGFPAPSSPRENQETVRAKKLEKETKKRKDEEERMRHEEIVHYMLCQQLFTNKKLTV
ncbi:hypothetical protein BDP27DRAFT_1547602 [Rhodocollybia butyracea]|uniref:LAGLIDADG homing endonuclease n=1 Tax=Rhodocollybia butyracea TaxID=206335 RepID=A0A9P5PHX2_9AGAR|nr:hypothetical protein BDP27DRAFT_1547602 [Rhodocollybia butyracea]